MPKILSEMLLRYCQRYRSSAGIEAQWLAIPLRKARMHSDRSWPCWQVGIWSALHWISCCRSVYKEPRETDGESWVGIHYHSRLRLWMISSKGAAEWVLELEGDGSWGVPIPPNHSRDPDVCRVTATREIFATVKGISSLATSCLSELAYVALQLLLQLQQQGGCCWLFGWGVPRQDTCRGLRKMS